MRTRARGNGVCCGRYPYQGTGRTKSVPGSLIDAFYAENAGDFADIGENGLELAAVHDFQAGVNARVGAIRAAFEIADVGAGAADDGGDFREKAGAIFGANDELNREGCSGFATPLDGDAALGLIHQILHIGAKLGVHSDTATARDVADDVVTGDRVTTLRAKNEEIVMALYDEGRIAHAEHALNGFDDGGLCIFGLSFRGLSALAENFGENLASRVLSEADSGEEVFHFGETVIGSDSL